ncbi:hypothetical protein FIU97_02240 [Roseivivax sp. THAF40]|uniref:hypothetical protein n=1 Tax=Roseivivax sp. THAF40 TaxID=2587858 RepID=UPI0012A9A299|nr:hypothetical protein [Roseivivax sp. THAF40]QFT45385.1 hypothetical protein FIU97_02240 [Roseivivax sp. THAF40]
MKRLISAFILVLASPDTGQAQHSGHRPGMAHEAAGPVLQEPGQSAFAALSEVVQVLEADPETDWSRVDIAGLRAHLVDMDLLATGARVESVEIAGGLTAQATGEAVVLAGLKRMVPAHAEQLRAETAWSVTVKVLADSVELTVTSDDPATTARIRGLGFFGLMASQDHHRAHHMAIARGEMPHDH